MRSEVLVASDVLKGNEGKRIDKKKKKRRNICFEKNY